MVARPCNPLPPAHAPVGAIARDRRASFVGAGAAEGNLQVCAQGAVDADVSACVQVNCQHPLVAQ